ncbi:MAG: ATP-binding protein [Balneolaceae bacterium]
MNENSSISEEKRNQLLIELGLLDSEPEKAYDDITDLAADIMKAPISLISLLDSKRQFLKSNHGLEIRETPIEHSFCAHAIRTPDETMVIEDVRKDPRFENNPLVTGDPKIIFYAGVPLLASDGIALGSLCVIGREPKKPTARQLSMLRKLAGQVVQLIELRRREKEAATLVLSLQKSHEHYQLVNRATSDALWDFNALTGELEWGSGFLTLFGYDPEEIQPDFNFMAEKIHPEDRERFVRTAQSYLAGSDNREKWSEEYRFQKADGSYAFVHDKALFIRGEDGKPVRVVGAMSDITHRKDQEDSLKQLNIELEQKVAELVRSNASLEKFTRVIFHDLQEPLRMVNRFMTRLEERYGSDLENRALEYVRFARDGAERMKTIILKLLEFSMAGSTEYKLEKLDPQVLLSAYQQTRSRLIREKEATFHSDGICPIRTFRQPLAKCLYALLDNALLYSKRGQPPEVNIRMKEKEGYWIFSVEDNGVGIDPIYHDRIFTLFQLTDTEPQQDGIGIGLALVKKHVESWGGEVWLESEVGKGSTFFFTIPKNSDLTG